MATHDRAFCRVAAWPTAGASSPMRLSASTCEHPIRTRVSDRSWEALSKLERSPSHGLMCLIGDVEVTSAAMVQVVAAVKGGRKCPSFR